MKSSDTITQVNFDSFEARCLEKSFDTSVESITLELNIEIQRIARLHIQINKFMTFLFRNFLPGTKVNLSIRRYSYTHVFSGHVVIFCMLYVPEVSIRCPYEVRRIIGHIEWRGRVMAHAWIFPPLAEENVHAVLLKMKQKEHEHILKEHKKEGKED